MNSFAQQSGKLLQSEKLAPGDAEGGWWWLVGGNKETTRYRNQI